MRVRYQRWSGEQEPFPPDITAEGVLDELHDELLSGTDVGEALERLLRRGLSGRTAGLADLRRRVEEARRRELQRMGVEGPLARIAERLEDILARERAALDADASPDAGARRDELDRLPSDVGGRIAGLQSHRWSDPRAESDFNALLEELRRDVADATFGRLAGALGSMSPEDLEATRQLLGDLNAMIAKDARGEDTTADFEEFARRWGSHLGWDGRDDAPQNLEELLEELARRMAAMSRLLAGLSPDQRAQLAALAEDLLGDLDLSFEADQLRRALESRFPELGWREPLPGAEPEGWASESLSGAVDWMEHLQELTDLGEQLSQDYAGARLEDVDEDALRRALGGEAVRDLRALREIERVLEEAGAVRRRHGRLELTARGIRRLGDQALARIYGRLVEGTTGAHRTSAAGGEGEPTGSTRPLRFGDPFRLDVARTVSNAILRGAVEGPPDGRVRLKAEDFALAEAERRVRVTTVLLLDMSFSMPLRGNWEPAKRMALALSSLVASKFPEDRLHIVGFSDYARQIEPRNLLVTGWERVYGTNMQHAFLLARRLLAAAPDSDHQVVMVTDGEPTAHLEDGPDGPRALFAWPPEPRTLRLTLQEGLRLARTGATLNVFLLDHDPGAAEFVEHMVSRMGGRILYPDLADLGRLVVREHRRSRR